MPSRAPATCAIRRPTSARPAVCSATSRSSRSTRAWHRRWPGTAKLKRLRRRSCPLRTYGEAVDRTSSASGRRLRKRRAARRGVERRGRRELEECDGLLVDRDDRELTGRAKRDEECIAAHAERVRL